MKNVAPRGGQMIETYTPSYSVDKSLADLIPFSWCSNPTEQIC